MNKTQPLLRVWGRSQETVELQYIKKIFSVTVFQVLSEMLLGNRAVNETYKHSVFMTLHFSRGIQRVDK